MKMTVEDYREGFRRHTLAFCMPAAHAEFSSKFLDEFSERVLKKDWRDVSTEAHWRVPSLLTGSESEEEVVAEIGTLRRRRLRFAGAADVGSDAPLRPALKKT